MSNLSLYKRLFEYQKKGMASFHTPGHKGNFFKICNLANFDYTELDSTDDLYNSKGPILETEKKASKIFSSGCSLISAGGCTLCIQTMIALFCKKNSTVVCSRVIHRSAINAMAILDIKPKFIFPKVDKNTGLFKQITSKEVEVKLKEYPNTSAVYVTSPDYYGTMANIDAISTVCKRYNVPLLVDNAHGSHLAFLKPNHHPLALGADASADSLHKTLPVLTGGAVLNLKNKDLYKKAKSWMEFFGSSSPSFPIMASIDVALDWCKKDANQAFNALKKRVYKINKLSSSFAITNQNERFSFAHEILKILSSDNISFIDFALVCKNFIFFLMHNFILMNYHLRFNPKIPNAFLDYLVSKKSLSFLLLKESLFCQNKQFESEIYSRDPVRICLNVSKIGVNGKICAKFFRKMKIEVEFYDEKFVVLIPTPFNTEKDFIKLEKAIKYLLKNTDVSLENDTYQDVFFSVPKIACSLHEAVFEYESELLDTKNSIGRVAAKSENICPPGIPLVLPGEILDKNLVEILIKSGIKKVNVLKQNVKADYLMNQYKS